MIGLPPHAVEKLRAAMEKHNGIKYWTCVNANLRVMEDAGFTSGKRKLSSIYFPYAMASYLRENGLEFEGKPVQLEVVRTTTMDMEAYARSVIAAELMTFCRHADRSLEGKAKKSKIWKGVSAVVHSPSTLYHHFRPVKPADPLVREIAPALPSNVQYEGGFQVKASMPSKFGLFLRQFVGAHTLTEVRQERVNPLDYLERHLKPFPQPNPSFVTRLKKRLLFSRPMIALLRFLMAARYVELGNVTERDLYDMLRTDSEKKSNVYNYVITNKRIVLVRTSVRMKLVDWVLSKHLVASGYLENPASASGEEAEFVLCAGEGRKSLDGALVLNGNSGTYQPTDDELVQAGKYVQAVVPNVPVRVELATHD
jgi:hypothetical protein